MFRLFKRESEKKRLKQALEEKTKEAEALKQALKEAKESLVLIKDELKAAHNLISEMEGQAASSIGTAIWAMMNGEHAEMEVAPWTTQK